MDESHFGGNAQTSKSRQSSSIGLSATVPFTFTLTRQTKPFFSGRTSTTLPRGHVLRGEFSALTRTISRPISTAAHLERTKAVNPNRCKGWSVRSQPINGEVSHFLFADWALVMPTVNALGEYSSYDGLMMIQNFSRAKLKTNSLPECPESR